MQKPPLQQIYGFNDNTGGAGKVTITGYKPGPLSNAFAGLEKMMTPQQLALYNPQRGEGSFTLSNGTTMPASQLIQNQQTDVNGRVMAASNPTQLNQLSDRGLTATPKTVADSLVGYAVSPTNAPVTKKTFSDPVGVKGFTSGTKGMGGGGGGGTTALQTETFMDPGPDQTQLPPIPQVESVEEILAKQRTAAHGQAESAYETGRTATLADAMNGINTAYAPYNDEYFNKFSQDFTDYYTPQVGSQYDDARKSLDLKYANSGGANNSEAQATLAQLLQRRTAEEANVKTRAATAAGDFKTSVYGGRQALLDELNSDSVAGTKTLGDSITSADPELSALKTRVSPFQSRAQTAAGGVARPDYSAMGQLFSDIVGPDYMSSPQNAAPAFSAGSTGLYQPVTPNSSARVVV